VAIEDAVASLNTQLDQMATAAARREVQIVANQLRGEIREIARDEITVAMDEVRRGLRTEIDTAFARIPALVSSEVRTATADLPRLIRDEINLRGGRITGGGRITPGGD
jgi:hypothetical protein